MNQSKTAIEDRPTCAGNLERKGDSDGPRIAKMHKYLDTEADKNKIELIQFSDTDFSNPFTLFRPPYKERRSIIMVTILDTNLTIVDIKKMMEAGMDVARFQVSHLSKEDRQRMLGQVDKAAGILRQKARKSDWPVATCIDLKTCIVKTGLIEEHAPFIDIPEGSSVLLTYNVSEFDKCNEKKIFVDNPLLAQEVKVGMEISIGQQQIMLNCVSIESETSIKCKVIQGGKLTNLNLVLVRGLEKKRPLLTKADYRIVRFAMENQVDLIICHYISTPKTLKHLKKYMLKVGKRVRKPFILVGLTTQEELDNFDDIAKECDGFVFARDILHYELDEKNRYKLSQIQKWVGAKCKALGKPFYVSGGVFEDSIRDGEYTDREITDVTNALLDGACGFIIKDCDVIENILLAIQSLDSLCKSIEPYTNTNSEFWRLIDEMKMPLNAAEATMLSCAAIANQSESRVIIIPTVTGDTVEGLLRLRPACMVITVSTKVSVTRRLQALRCIVPLIYSEKSGTKWQQSIDNRINMAVDYAVKKNWLSYGNPYVTLQRGSDCSAFCDMVRISVVTTSNRGKVECTEDGEWMAE